MRSAYPEQLPDLSGLLLLEEVVARAQLAAPFYGIRHPRKAGRLRDKASSATEKYLEGIDLEDFDR